MLPAQAHPGPTGRYRARQTAPLTPSEGVRRHRDALFGDDFFGRRTFATRPADLVVYNALAFFAGELAHELGIPAVRMTCQPLLPSRRASLSLLGGRDRGALLNRASYEIFRLVSTTVLRGAFRTQPHLTGAGERLRPGCNPLTLGLSDSHQLLAFSSALAPDPGDWPRPYTQTGFLLRRPEPSERLQDEVERFLEAGPPPV